jgi:hypothetical protein
LLCYQIIFGKKDSTVIELSAIASGTGGIVINGEHVNNHNGFSVSTAGDVNGDGLDDLIVVVYTSLRRTNNQIIQAIAVNIACVGS